MGSSSGDSYRVKAAEINARAAREANPVLRAEFKKLALAYLLLAEQADSNAKTDVVYEPPPERPVVQQQQQSPPQQPQQQQQQQAPKKA